MANDLRIGPVFETKDYAGIELKFKDHRDFAWLIIDKNNLQLFLMKMPKNQLEPALWIQLEGNTLRFMTTESFKFKEIQLEEFITTAVPVGKLKILEPPMGLGKYLHDWKSTLMGLMMFLLVAWVFWKTFKVNYSEETVPFTEEDPLFTGNYELWLKRLAPHSGQVISQKQLEEILGVQGIKNQDLRKVRRSRAIKALNDHMLKYLDKPVIQRERDEQDKRVIHYQIASFSSGKQPNERRKNPASV